MKEQSDSKNKYIEEDIIKMLEFLVDNIFVVFAGTSFGIQTTDEELDLPYIYWIPKMRKNPYKYRFIAGSSKCSTKPLSILLTKLLAHIK